MMMAIYLPPISPSCPHIECLLYAKHSVGCFIYNSHSCMSRGIIFIFQKGNQSTERSSTRSTVTQLVSGRVRIWLWIFLAPVLLPLSHTSPPAKLSVAL